LEKADQDIVSIFQTYARNLKTDETVERPKDEGSVEKIKSNLS
jgi:hypothetical protein